MVSLAIQRDGYAIIRAKNMNVVAAIPCRFNQRLSRLMSGLPRGFEDVAVSPGDFEIELRLDHVTNPVHVDLYHRLRRVWVTVLRNRPREK